jgi:tripartite ATP-independent transporter DctM subunit
MIGIEWLSIAIIAALVVLMMIGVPLVFVTGSIAVGALLLGFGLNGLPLIFSRVYSLSGEYLLTAVPMFLLMASILEKAGVARDLYDAMHVFAGRLRGGLALQTTVVAVILATTTGVVGGEVILLGLVALPQMLRLGYDKHLALGTICAGGALGAMIPPSIVLIVFGLVAQVSIGDLFAASFTPGALMAALYMGYIFIRCALNPSLGPPAHGGELDQPLAEKLKLLSKIGLPMLVVVSVLGSIYGGIASITEAASIGVLGAALAAWRRGRLDFPMLRESALQCMRTCGTVIWLTFGASALIGVYGLIGGTRFVARLIEGLPLAPLMIVVLMMLIIMVLGCIMDWIGICLLTMPIFVPVIVKLGFDPIWFGVLFCINVQIAYLTPPFGPAAFFLKGVAPPEVTLQDIFVGVLPFIGLQLVALLLVLFFPQIALWPI